MRHLIPTLVLLLLSTNSYCCLIVFCSDGVKTLVGNHEDWFARDAAIKVNPPAGNRYGSVIFTFSSEGWAQGGMNDRGLFFDATHTPLAEIEFDPGAVSFNGYIWQEVLDRAANVEEALAMIRRYELPELRQAHILIADASGHAALIGASNGRLAIKEVNQSCLIQTNFNPWHPELSDEPVCPRHTQVAKHLGENDEVSVDNFKAILSETHQGALTVYSNVYDLVNRTIYTYPERDFANPVTLSLPEAFSKGACQLSLEQQSGEQEWICQPMRSGQVVLKGKVIDHETGDPVPYANIGIPGENIGTLSDPDGSFEITIPASLGSRSLDFSSIGFEGISIPVVKLQNGNAVALKKNTVLLDEIVFTAKGSVKKTRLGWMGGKDGILPLDTIQGGGAVALLVEAPSVPAFVEKLQVRLMYNSKDTVAFRLHLYGYDSATHGPGAELLEKEIILKDQRRFGWMRFDLTDFGITIPVKKFFIGLEWIDNRKSREAMLAGLRQWEEWKKTEHKKGNRKVTYVTGDDGNAHYKYQGNMMDWPGFAKLPPFTGLMIETGKRDETRALKTFERKTSFGDWVEVPSTLNAVITVVTDE